MFKVFYLALPLLFLGCSSHQEIAMVPKTKEKIFLNEDTYILLALRAEEIHDFKSSAEIFKKLYHFNHKKEYLYRSLQDLAVVKDFEGVVTEIDAYEKEKNSLEDRTLLNYKVSALIELNRVSEAEPLALKLLDGEFNVENYIVVATLYVKLKKPQKALHYLEIAYKKNYDERALEKLSLLLYTELDRKKEAIDIVEKHLSVYGNSLIPLERLLFIYSSEKDMDGLLSTLLRIDKIKKIKEYEQKIVQIYNYKREYVKLMYFLEESGADDVRLLQLYKRSKAYKKASILADRLYQESGTVDFLAQSAIYEYEGAKSKENKKLLESVLKKLERTVEIQRDPLYLNYLGYLLIDHKIDIKKGIEYVNEALNKKPNSAYYLDSLAWGYYMLGDCKKAKSVIDKAYELDTTKNEEVALHLREIDRCLKN